MITFVVLQMVNSQNCLKQTDIYFCELNIMQGNQSAKLVFVAMQNKYPFGLCQQTSNSKQRILVRRTINITQSTRKTVLSKLRLLKELSYQTKAIIKIQSILEQSDGIHVIYEYIPIHVDNWITNINEDFLKNIRFQVANFCKLLTQKNIHTLLKITNIGMSQSYQVKIFIDYDFDCRNSINHLKEWYHRNLQLVFKPYIKKICEKSIQCLQKPTVQGSPIILLENNCSSSEALNLKHRMEQQQDKLVAQTKIQSFRAAERRNPVSLNLISNQRESVQHGQMMTSLGNRVNLLRQHKIKEEILSTDRGVLAVKQAIQINKAQSSNLHKLPDKQQNGMLGLSINSGPKKLNRNPQFKMFRQVQEHFIRQAKDVLGFSQKSSSVSSFENDFGMTNSINLNIGKTKGIMRQNSNQMNYDKQSRDNSEQKGMYMSTNLSKNMSRVGNLKSSKKTAFQIQFSDGVNETVTKKYEHIKMNEYRTLVSTNERYFNDFMDILADEQSQALPCNQYQRKGNQIEGGIYHLQHKQVPSNQLISNRGHSTVDLLKSDIRTKSKDAMGSKSIEKYSIQNKLILDSTQESRSPIDQKNHQSVYQIQKQVSHAIYSSMQVMRKLKAKK